MTVRKKLREVVRNFESWMEHEADENARDAYAKCLDRIQQLFADELKKV